MLHCVQAYYPSMQHHHPVRHRLNSKTSKHLNPIALQGCRAHQCHQHCFQGWRDWWDGRGQPCEGGGSKKHSTPLLPPTKQPHVTTEATSHSRSLCSSMLCLYYKPVIVTFAWTLARAHHRRGYCATRWSTGRSTRTSTRPPLLSCSHPPPHPSSSLPALLCKGPSCVLWR